MGKLPFYIDDAAGEPHGYELRCDMVQPDFMKVFGVRLTSGDPEALTRPQTAIIPRSMAENLFEGDAVGKILRTDSNWFFPDGELTVGAVYEDFPSNSNLQNSIYFAVDERVTPYTYGGANFICYLLLDSRESASLVENEFNSNFDFSLSWMSPIELVPMEDIYFMEQGGDLHLPRPGAHPEHQHPESSGRIHLQAALDADHGDSRHCAHRSDHLLPAGRLDIPDAGQRQHPERAVHGSQHRYHRHCQRHHHCGRNPCRTVSELVRHLICPGTGAQGRFRPLEGRTHVPQRDERHPVHSSLRNTCCCRTG